MTKQEAEAWKRRLVKIWVPHPPCGEHLNWRVDATGILFESTIALGVSEQVEVSVMDTRQWTRTKEEIYRSYSLEWFQFSASHDKQIRAVLLYDGPDYKFRVMDFSAHETYEGFQEQLREVQEFLVQWAPVFHRNCWLSGLPIEATAHEKAEWVQGFTREEIEAWNLKM